MTDLEAIEKRLEILEKNFSSFLKMYNNDKKYDGYDKDGLRYIDGTQGEAISLNSNDVEDVRTAIEEVYEMILEEGK